MTTTADGIVGERVHQIMWRERISQARIADALGLTQSSVSKRLRGSTTWTLDELLAIARVLGVSVAELLPGDDYDPVVNGRGRIGVRHQGLEPRTRCFRVGGRSLEASAPLRLVYPSERAA